MSILKQPESRRVTKGGGEEEGGGARWAITPPPPSSEPPIIEKIVMNLFMLRFWREISQSPFPKIQNISWTVWKKCNRVFFMILYMIFFHDFMLMNFSSILKKTKCCSKFSKNIYLSKLLEKFKISSFFDSKHFQKI